MWISSFNCQCEEFNQPCLFKGSLEMLKLVAILWKASDNRNLIETYLFPIEVVCCLFPKMPSLYCQAECEVLGSNWGNWWGTLVFPTQGGVQDHGGPWWGPGQTGSEVPSHLLITTSSLCTKFEQFLMVINTVSPPNCRTYPPRTWRYIGS